MDLLSLWAKIRSFFAPPVFQDPEKTRVAGLLNVILSAFVLVGGLSLPGILFLPGASLMNQVLLATMVLVCLGLWFLLRRGYVRQAGLLLVGFLFAGGVLSVYAVGTIRDPVAAMLVLCIVVAGLLVGRRAAYVMSVLCPLALLALFWAETNGLLPNLSSQPAEPAEWFALSLVCIMVGVMLGLAVSSIERALALAQAYASDLDAQRAQLQVVLEDRTRELGRRTGYLGAATALAHDATVSQDDVQGLLDRAAAVISEQFGFYHTGVFLLGPTGQWVVLRAASSEGGKRMLARGHQLRAGVGIEGQGIVGYVAAAGEHRVTLDVRRDASFAENPDLPETRSEVALPMRVGAQSIRGVSGRAHESPQGPKPASLAIGVLDVQSTQPDAFTDEDVVVLQTLADQLAVAVSNARLLQQLEETLESEQRLRGELARDAWTDLARLEPDLGFLCDIRGTMPAGNAWDGEMLDAVRTGAPAAGEDNAWAVPVKIRGQVVAVIDAHLPLEIAEWTAERRELLEALAEQLGVALESAQLYRDAQTLAARERVAGEIADHMRGAIDMDDLLRAAVQETAAVLGASRAFVQWVPVEDK